MVNVNLNDTKIKCADTADIKLANNSVHHNQATSAYFKDLSVKLIKYIEAADVVVGCVAWLTERSILNALKKKDEVSLIVQKEDFLRPDGQVTKSELRGLYDSLKSPCRAYMGEPLSSMNMAGDCFDPIGAIRCVGIRDNDKTHPRMHNKFALFCRSDKRIPEDLNYQSYGYDTIKPYAVWTGSFNWTHNATNSLENAVVLYDPEIVDAFYKEYKQIAAISESLDWTSEYVKPDWRIGT
jgi:HKD family nuclease